MAYPLLSIIIPTKDPLLSVLRRCIAAALAVGAPNDIELVIVDSTADSCVRDELVNLSRVNYVRSVPPRGIYNAYNLGVSRARGRFVLFLGYDDIILPGLATLLARVASAGDDVDVALGAVLVEARGLVVPKQAFYSLIFRNWPHQGILYRRAIFDTNAYDERYWIQADHALNIQLARSGLRFKFTDLVVSYFSTGGLSSAAIDWPFRQAMPDLVAREFGVFWGFVCRARRRLGDVRLALRKLRRAP